LPPAGDAAVKPVIHNLGDIVDDSRLGVIERDEMMVTLEVVVVRLGARSPSGRSVRPPEPEP
jgi:hypothetical protein